MATTIKLKNGSGAPLAGDLVQGEPAFDLTNKRLYTEDSGGTVIEVGTNPTSLTTGTFTSTGIDDNATSTAITIDSSENVGIGTASPVDLIHGHINSASTTGLRLTNSVTGSTSSDGFQIYCGSTGQAVLRQRENSEMVFMTNNTERMTIDSSGNVGIGTTSPVYDMELVRTGDAQFLIQAGISSVSDVLFGDTGDVNIGRLRYSHADNSMQFQVNNAERMRIDGSGSILYATGSGQGYTFSASGSSAGVANMFCPAGYTLAFGTNSTERMRIDSSGNLLVGGTSTPTSSAGNIVLYNGTAPTGNATNGVILYAEDVSASSELKVRDEAGNVTTLSPHNFDLIQEGPSEDMAWSYYSERDGKRINVDMLKAIRLLEQLSGEKLVHIS